MHNYKCFSTLFFTARKRSFYSRTCHSVHRSSLSRGIPPSVDRDTPQVENTLGQRPLPEQSPPDRQPPAATEARGTHPTGMHIFVFEHTFIIRFLNDGGIQRVLFMFVNIVIFREVWS